MAAKIIADKLSWQVMHGGVRVETDLDIRVHPLKTDKIALIVPGVDGSVTGYHKKYLRMAKKLNSSGVGVVRISNPFISSFDWEDNLRRALSYTRQYAKRYFDSSRPEVYILAHSAGASAAGLVACEYPYIKKLLLINAPAKLFAERFLANLTKFKGQIIIVYGERDPSFGFASEISKRMAKADRQFGLITVQGADHNFSEPHLHEFINLADKLAG